MTGEMEQAARAIVIEIIKDVLGEPGVFHDVKWVKRIAEAIAAHAAALEAKLAGTQNVSDDKTRQLEAKDALVGRLENVVEAARAMKSSGCMYCHRDGLYQALTDLDATRSPQRLGGDYVGPVDPESPAF